jgi:mannosyltransferase OCH1-like enzyme
MYQEYVENSVIPFNIFQTWHSKKLPPLMYHAIKIIKQNNPRFNYYYFDDADCREFIKNNFEKDVLDAFDSLIPGAFKADLWRYCILYKKGGIYLDIKYIPVNGFKFIYLTQKEHWVLDVDGKGIYNAFIACKPNNPILLKAINQIVKHVKYKYYGNNRLDVTGPLLLAKYFTKEEKQNFDMKHFFINSLSNRFIKLNDSIILKSYPGYLFESNKYKKTDYYGTLWKQKMIYKK